MTQEPDFDVSPESGQLTRLTLTPRSRPWHIRVSGHDIYATVAAAEAKPEPEPGPEAEPFPEGLA